MAVGVAREGLTGARARQKKRTGQACAGQLDSLMRRTDKSDAFASVTCG
jgi:hypothetical protein